MQKTILAVFAFLALSGAAFGAEPSRSTLRSRSLRDQVLHPARWGLLRRRQGRLRCLDRRGRQRIQRPPEPRLPHLQREPESEGPHPVRGQADKVEALDVYFDWTMPVGEVRPLISRWASSRSRSVTRNGDVLQQPEPDRPHYANAFLEKKVLASARDQGVMATGDLWEYDIPVQLHLAVMNGNGLGKKSDSNSGKQFNRPGRGDPPHRTHPGRQCGDEPAGGRRQPGELHRVGRGPGPGPAGIQVVAEVFGGDNNEAIVSSGSTSLEPRPSLPGTPRPSTGPRAAGSRRPGWRCSTRHRHRRRRADAPHRPGGLLVQPNFRWQVNVIHTTFQDDAEDGRTDVVSQWTVRL